MKKRLEFSLEIEASPSKIWKALWSDQCYKAWAAVFYAGSYFQVEGWEVGGSIHFLDADNTGIYSVIEKYIPENMVQFKHIGNVVEGKEQPIDAETKKWSGSTEVYKILEGDGHNTLLISLDVMDEHFEYMSKMFPKALEVIKKNSIS